MNRRSHRHLVFMALGLLFATDNSFAQDDTTGSLQALEKKGGFRDIKIGMECSSVAGLQLPSKNPCDWDVVKVSDNSAIHRDIGNAQIGWVILGCKGGLVLDITVTTSIGLDSSPGARPAPASLSKLSVLQVLEAAYGPPSSGPTPNIFHANHMDYSWDSEHYSVLLTRKPFGLTDLYVSPQHFRSGVFKQIWERREQCNTANEKVEAEAAAKDL